MDAYCIYQKKNLNHDFLNSCGINGSKFDNYKYVYAISIYVINGNVHHYSKLFIVDW